MTYSNEIMKVRIFLHIPSSMRLALIKRFVAVQHCLHFYTVTIREVYTTTEQVDKQFIHFVQETYDFVNGNNRTKTAYDKLIQRGCSLFTTKLFYN